MAKYHILIEVKSGMVSAVRSNLSPSRTWVDVIDHDTQDEEQDRENAKRLKEMASLKPIDVGF